MIEVGPIDIQHDADDQTSGHLALGGGIGENAKPVLW